MIDGLMRNRRGVSLPLVILMMALLALAVTAGFSRVSEERHIVGDQQAQVDAFAVAQSGLERYVALRDTQPTTDDSVTIPVGPRDTAYVVLYPVRTTTAPTARTYVIRSRGVSHGAPRFSFRTPPAQRTVAQYATWQSVSMSVLSAWTSISGLRSEGGTGILNGADACFVAADVGGIAVPDNVPLSGLNGFDAPPNPSSILSLGATPTVAANAVRIDWNSIINGGVLQPDYTLTSSTGWPLFDPAKWPVIRVDGDLTVGGGEAGQGLLVVTGNMTMNAGFTWNGVILVGRTLDVVGTAPVVRGAIVSGLDVKLVGATFLESRSGQNASDQINLQYDSCHVAAALARYGHLQLIANAWTDSWPEN